MRTGNRGKINTFSYFQSCRHLDVHIFIIILPLHSNRFSILTRCCQLTDTYSADLNFYTLNDISLNTTFKHTSKITCVYCNRQFVFIYLLSKHVYCIYYLSKIYLIFLIICTLINRKKT